MSNKIKVFMISDALLAPSGVGTQTRYIAEALLKSGKFTIRQFGGAISHVSYQPVQTEEYGNDLIMYPVNGYGTPEMVRSFIANEKPDIMWLMTDPRFFVWLFEVENEFRHVLPIVYYNIWDNYPYPKYNKVYYDSVDQLVAISKITEDINKTVSPEVDCEYIPHSVNPDFFKIIDEEEIKNFRAQTFKDPKRPDAPANMDKVIFFFNSRNARRKQSSSLLWWFRDFLDMVGDDKAALIMHTDPKDMNGSDLEAIIQERGLNKGQVLFSREKIGPDSLAFIYNMADCTLAPSDSEGFGCCLSACNSYIISNNKLKKLEEIKVNDYVLTLDGKFHRVQALSEKRKENVYKLKAMGNEELFLTEEHRVLCYKQQPISLNRKSNNYINKNVLQEKKQDEIKLEWIKTKDLNVDDYVVIPRMKKIEALPKTIDILNFLSKKENISYDNEFVWNTKCHRNKKIKRHIELNDKFLEIVGWYLAEGCNTRGTFILDVHKKEQNIVDKIGEYIVENLGECLKYSLIFDKRENGNRCRLRIHSNIIGDFFGNLCGVGCRNKYIHNVFMTDPEKLGSLLRGYFLGDGNYEKYYKSYRVTSVNKSLLYQVRNILANKGIFSYISIEDNSKGFGNEKINRLKIGVDCYEDFCNFLNIEMNLEQKKLKEQKKESERRWFVKDDYILVPIRKIEKTDIMDDVMDIQVEGQHNFVANGIVVHNSVMESLNCGTPVIGTMTGGIQEQIFDGNEYFGVGLQPASKCIIGSQDVPYIYEDRISKEDFLAAMLKIFNMTRAERKELGKKGREHMQKNYNFETFNQKWVDLMLKVHEKFGSYKNRKGYKRFELKSL